MPRPGDLLSRVLGRFARYHFVSTWRFQAPITRLWEAIYDWRSWPSWWQGLHSAHPVGPGLARLVWQAPMGYVFVTHFRETRAVPPTELRGASTGDLVGEGVWQLSEAGGVTTVRYTWDATTHEWWAVLLSPVARRAFVWNHNRLMEQGARGLAGHLGVALLSVEER
jgi:hypothetical protein